MRYHPTLSPEPNLSKHLNSSFLLFTADSREHHPNLKNEVFNHEIYTKYSFTEGVFEEAFGLPFIIKKRTGNVFKCHYYRCSSTDCVSGASGYFYGKNNYFPARCR